MTACLAGTAFAFNPYRGKRYVRRWKWHDANVSFKKGTECLYRTRVSHVRFELHVRPALHDRLRG